MAKANLTSMSVDALLKLRGDVVNVLSQKAEQLKAQLSHLGGELGNARRGPGSALKGRKAAVKYRDGAGNAWSGRGAHPVWLRGKLKAGAKLEDFAVTKSAAARKTSARKTKRKKRKAKR
jgi:DNA-binding protein H-NS